MHPYMHTLPHQRDWLPYAAVHSVVHSHLHLICLWHCTVIAWDSCQTQAILRCGSHLLQHKAHSPYMCHPIEN